MLFGLVHGSVQWPERRWRYLHGVVFYRAMMLPTSLPLVELFHRMTRQRPDHAQLAGLVLTGYLLTWTLLGVVAVLGDGILHTAAKRSAWLEAHAWLIGAGIFVVAGLY